MLLNSVSDSLYNNMDPTQMQFKKKKGVKDQKTEHDFQLNAMGMSAPRVSKPEFDRFLIDLTITYEFDYIELYTPVEIIDFLREMHLSIKDKPHRKELSMYSRKGFKPGKKALMLGGFDDPLSITYISWLMCIPGLSENKAIAIAKKYSTISDLMEALKDPSVPEKTRKLNFQDIEVPSSNIGDKPKKIGKVLAERVFHYFMSVDPKVVIN